MSDIPGWDSSYEIGVPTLDRQHQRFFQLVAELDELAGSGDQFRTLTPGYKSRMLSLILQLRSYALEHFVAEEKLQESSRYPNYIRHRKQHNAAGIRLMDMENRVLGGDIYVAREMLDFASQWLRRHILEEDMNFARHLRENPPDKAPAKPATPAEESPSEPPAQSAQTPAAADTSDVPAESSENSSAEADPQNTETPDPGSHDRESGDAASSSSEENDTPRPNQAED